MRVTGTPAKAAARANIILAINEIDWGTKNLSVRINGLDTECWYRDVVDILEQAGERIDRDQALVRSCGLYFAPQRLGLQTGEWRDYWQARRAPQWLLDLPTAEVRRRIEERIRREVADFDGLIGLWDAINEVVIMPEFTAEPTRRRGISYAVFCLKKKNT